jgi:hypothetical protein
MHLSSCRKYKSAHLPDILGDQPDDGSFNVGGLYRVDQFTAEKPTIGQIILAA